MESRHGIRQTGLTGHDGRVTTGDADGHDRLASRNLYGYDQLLLLDQVPDESDLTVDIRLFKRRLKRIDERSSLKRLQVSRKGQG